MNHLKALTRPRAATSGPISQVDPILFKQFMIDMLTALNGLMTRKNVGQT